MSASPRLPVNAEESSNLKITVCSHLRAIMSCGFPGKLRIRQGNKRNKNIGDRISESSPVPGPHCAKGTFQVFPQDHLPSVHLLQADFVFLEQQMSKGSREVHQ